MTDGETKPTFAKYPWGGEVFIPSTAWERHDLLTRQLCLTYCNQEIFGGNEKSMENKAFHVFFIWLVLGFLFCYKYFELIWFAVHWSKQNGGVPCPYKVSCWSHLAAGIEPTPFSRFLSSQEGWVYSWHRCYARAGLEVHPRHILVQNLHFLSFLSSLSWYFHEEPSPNWSKPTLTRHVYHWKRRPANPHLFKIKGVTRKCCQDPNNQDISVLSLSLFIPKIWSLEIFVC